MAGRSRRQAGEQRSDESAANESVEIVVTATAKSKAYRLFSTWKLRERVRKLDGQLWQKGNSREYHLVTDGWVIVFVVEDDGDRLVVVTQMHVHADYQREATYGRPDEPPVE